MFDVGFTELLLIGVVALVVIGPERLPAVAKTAGQWIAKLQRFVKGVKTDIASELESGDLKKMIGDQREQISELRKIVNSAKRDFEASTTDALAGAKNSIAEMESAVSEDATDERDNPSVASGSVSNKENEITTQNLPETSGAEPVPNNQAGTGTGS